ncbi:adenylate/guanylate cyclase domain-containing protein [Williamsia sterculiae]|uniref:Adenylate cyclase n=1 Tax=Williamsia sterculiae TaxID=1344003 RepID=A0A1N7CBC7_9NOCA|nr:adenylate/guanylate cyclase domain-containing protein [Williamsia sterculiae]SIR60908.1 adenylate cyclase [Williamsia sterculiae]
MPSESPDRDTPDPTCARSQAARPDPAERRFTKNDAVAEFGVTEEFGDRVWNAFGFPAADPDEPVLTRAEMDALAMLMTAEYVSGDNATAAAQGAEIATARVVGQAMSRLADWQAARIRDVDADPSVDVDAAAMIDSLQVMQNMVWRRHLDSAMRNLGGATDTATESVVGFVDIVGYTALSRRIGMNKLNDLLQRYEGAVTEIVVSHDGSIIKTLGDGVLFLIDVAEDARANIAAAVGLELLDMTEKLDLPQVRVGLALGPVLHRYGDVFGEAVNIAARLSSSARPGAILVDSTLGEAIDDPRFHTRSIAPLSVRGYKRLRAMTLHWNRKFDGGTEQDSTPGSGDDAHD